MAKKSKREKNFEKICHWVFDIKKLQNACNIMRWDREIMMKEGSDEQSSAVSQILDATIAEKQHDRKFNKLIDETDPDPDNEMEVAYMRILRHDKKIRENSLKKKGLMEGEESEEGEDLNESSRLEWRKAKEENDFARLIPSLKKTVEEQREEGRDALTGETPYEGLLQDYAPGMTEDEIDGIFDEMQPRLVELRKEIMDAPPAPELKGHFDEKGQLELIHDIAERFGFDHSRGRIDVSRNFAFMIGKLDDVRIVVRMNESDPLHCLYSGIHEIGHAVYEQNIDRKYRLSELGEYSSISVHESQSRIMENQIARSRSFCEWLFEEMRRRFGDIGVDNPDDFHAAINRVTQNPIRVGADEVQYNMHIIMRYDMEKALINGHLEVENLEREWNARFKRDFGFMPKNASDGVLQDMHWPHGMFGYFPTYALGNVYAGCLHERMRKDIPDLDESLRNGDATPAAYWLKDHVHQYGSLHESKDLMEKACGGKPTSGPLMDYLEGKYRDLIRRD